MLHTPCYDQYRSNGTLSQYPWGRTGSSRSNTWTLMAAHLARFRIALGITQEQLASVDLITHISEALGILPEIQIRHKTLDVQQPLAS